MKFWMWIRWCGSCDVDHMVWINENGSWGIDQRVADVVDQMLWTHDMLA